MYTIGIDIGGTNARVALIDSQMNILNKKQIKTENRKFNHVLEDLIYLVSQIDPKSQAQAIGIACAGPLDLDKGMVLDAPNLSNWSYKPFVSVIEEKTGLKTYLTNDANAAALAQDIGNNNYKSIVFITVSTGIGGGLVYDHKLIEGKFGYAGEIGSMIISDLDNDHPSLYKGTLESLCSGPALAKLASEKYEKTMKAEDLFRLYYKNDPLAMDLINLWVELFSRSIANLVQILEPEIFYLGGAVIINNPFLLKKIEEKTKEMVFDGLKDKIVLRPAKYKDDASLIGAAYHAKNKIKGE